MQTKVETGWCRCIAHYIPPERRLRQLVNGEFYHFRFYDLNGETRYQIINGGDRVVIKGKERFERFFKQIP